MEKKRLIMRLKIHGFNEKILKAFENVPREKFMPEHLKKYAYYDEAFPLEEGATISQPYTIAFMLNLLNLKKGQKILEIGSGSGYVLALLSAITKGEIYGVEIIKSLAEKSRRIISHLKYKKIKIIIRSGFKGLPEFAPYDRILVSASSDKIPVHLYTQLKDNGIIVIPVRNSIFQIRKERKKIKSEEFPGFVFVPLRETD